jgi:hypothetical protein
MSKIKDQIEDDKMTIDDSEYDWAKEARLTEIRTEEQFGHKARRAQFVSENYQGQEACEVERDNFQASGAENHRFDGQNQ